MSGWMYLLYVVVFILLVVVVPPLIKRYYYQRGQVAQSLRHDNAVDSASAVLSNPLRYKEILAPVKPTKDKK